MKEDEVRFCGQLVSFYDWDCECDLPAGHEGRHWTSEDYHRWGENGHVPIRWTLAWVDVDA